MPHLPIVKSLVALGLVGLVFLLRAPIENWAGVGTSPVLYLPAVTLAAWYGGLGPGLLAALISGCLWVYHDVPPVGSFFVPSAGDRFRVAVFTCESILLSVLMEILHASRRNADRFRVASSRDESRLRAILDNSSTPIWMKDAEGRYLVVNKPFEALVERRTSEIVGNPDADLKILELGLAIEREETLELDDGPHTFLSVKFPMRDEAGVIFAIGGISTDITELKRAQRRAVQAERLAAIGQMVTGLAHEGRNALQRSQACLEMLRFRLEDHPESLDLVSGIQDAQDDLQRLYEEVRTYAAPLVIARVEGSLRAIILEAWNQLEWTRRGRDAQLDLRGGNDDCCLVDAPRMVQVFRNLLDNALAACHDPVKIKVEWTRVEDSGKPGFRIILGDNGPGFLAEQKRNLFEPFSTTKIQGTGLGLAICRRIVEAHGGTIVAQFLKDVATADGAVLEIFLPGGE